MRPPLVDVQTDENWALEGIQVKWLDSKQHFSSLIWRGRWDVRPLRHWWRFPKAGWRVGINPVRILASSHWANVVNNRLNCIEIKASKEHFSQNSQFLTHRGRCETRPYANGDAQFPIRACPVTRAVTHVMRPKKWDTAIAAPTSIFLFRKACKYI